ncbi:MAG: AEC family transporter [Firmicutes bacterium]|nr:AEC family transporter [Bacillota bacterium]
MDNLKISLEAVAPMFLIMAVGFFVRRKGLLSEEDVRHMNKMVFLTLFPPLMFTNLYGRELSEAVNGRLIIYTLAAIAVVYLMTVVFVLRVEKSPRSRGAMIHAIYRSNFVIMGLPIVSNIFGSENLAMTSMMVTIVVPVFNVMAVTTLEIFRGGKPDPVHILKGIAKNPLILGAAAGLIAVFIDLQLPVFVEKTITMMSGAATPVALLLLGASFNVQSLERCKRNLIFCLLGRLVVVPAIAITGGIIMGFRDVALVTLLAVFASPTAVSSFTMAQQMDSDDELAGNCVIFSSMLSCLTMFLWIFGLKSFGLF